MDNPKATSQIRERSDSMEYPKLGKTRRNIYMGQEYLDIEAIAVQERKRTGRAVSVSDLIRRACIEFADAYWSRTARHPGEKPPSHSLEV